MDSNEYEGIAKYASLHYFKKPKMRKDSNGPFWRCYQLNKSACYLRLGLGLTAKEAYLKYLQAKYG